jgi:hypothetical protein
LRQVYRAKNWLKFFCLTFLALSLFLCFGAWREIFVGTNSWTDVSIGLILVFVGAGMATHACTYRIVLTDKSISRQSVFRKKSMQLDQIRCRREYEEYQDGPEGGVNVRYLELLSRGEIHSFRISKDDFDFDSVFWEWVLRIPEV